MNNVYRTECVKRFSLRALPARLGTNARTSTASTHYQLITDFNHYPLHVLESLSPITNQSHILTGSVIHSVKKQRKMSQPKKNAGSKPSIVAICFIALVFFAALSLFSMVTRPAAQENGADRNDMFHKPVIPDDSIGSIVPAAKLEEVIALNIPQQTKQSEEVQVKRSSTLPTPPRPHQLQLSPSRHNNTAGLPTLHAVTYASHGGRDDRFCRAIESAVRHEVDLIILGWGTSDVQSSHEPL